ncbi:type IX secretion system sortase PorU [Aureisphaera galaxeae]|uniref:type IX secretion system sortase PorU n=1 Tax=Aureisphaera galaxeae TaxID=1538023 RepID=UPI002350D716|nr:type IX secretion system sortase PorU [Aureisphaera galaxeae]MDC8005642.1 type IX secretion system sortase PorU [Aureisphaera galaxeae]
MMRKILLLFFIGLGVTTTYAQKQDITIQWEEDLEKTDISQRSEDKEEYSPLNLVMRENEHSFRYRWKDKGLANTRSAQISNIVYGNLTPNDLKKVNRALVPSTPTFELQSSYGRDIVYTTIEISPIVNVNGQLRKIRSFSVNYSYGSPSARVNRTPIQNSVLASGQWFKFRVEKTGVHRITRSFLNDLGVNTNGIDPRTIKIYGHGGKPLPLINGDNLFMDLPENAIQVVGEEDGSFDSGDFVLFYGISVDGRSDKSFAENGSNLNPYSDEAYYYVTVGGAQGLRVQPMVQPSGNAPTIIDTFHDYQFHEIDDFSPALVGRKWYGNRFDIENMQTFEFTFPNMIGQVPMRVNVNAASASEVSTSMSLSINNTALNPLTFVPLLGSTTLLSENFFNGEFPAPGGQGTVTVELEYLNGGNPASVGYLDYINIEALRRLEGVNGQLLFRNNDVANQTGIGAYQITNASQFNQVWDVTDPQNIRSVANENNASPFSFNVNLGELREYVAVNPNDYFSPSRTNDSRVPNQNLKGTILNDGSGNFQDIDYLIVTPSFLIQPALRLANHHKNVNGLNVKVVTTEQVYTEFSSGMQDISAIRNLVRYIYENASSPDRRIKYLCMFGDTSVDMKDRLSGNNNIVPTFHTVSSNDSLLSFMSDDFFGMMGEDDGGMSTNDILDIAVGRILADNVSLANTMVDKAIAYSLAPAYGNWRNNLVLVSDDVDKAGEFQSLEVTLDGIGDRITDEKPYINVKKIHSDAFQQETSAGGDRYPKVNEQIINDIELGALILNYFGHGGEDGLASEFIYTKDIANNLKNENRYPCIVTVTCEFTKFDNPLRITAGELTYWNPDGGAVALITTTRAILISTGVAVNEALAEDLFGFGLDIPVPPSEALRLTKNRITNPDKRVVFYVGDPAIRLAFPKQSIRITELNDEPISSSTVVLEALSKVKLGGQVLDESGNVLTNYNGVLEAKVFDKDVQRQTLGNDGETDSQGNLLILDFKTLGEVLFNGKATVLNGEFEFEFVVPRDIQIPVGQGKVSLYAKRNSVLEDQTGFNLDIRVGGLNENAPTDNQGPEIQLFMNDESFISGGITNDSPNLIAKISDENGINTASGIGHDIVAILDGDETNPFVLNEYYQAEVDDFTQGTANYKLRNLEEGLHTLTLKAWDVYNNSSTAEIQFIVFGNNQLEVRRVLNYPNPFVDYTEFWFEHNRPSEMLDVQVQIFTVTGKVVRTINQSVMSDGGLSREIVWDGLDDFGDKIGKGVYVYKLTVKSPLIDQQVEKFEKLVIL